MSMSNRPRSRASVRAARVGTRWLALSGAVLASLLASLVLNAPANAAPNKPYTVVLSGGVASTGPTVTATFTNKTATQLLGSANLTPPPGYSLSSASSSQGSATVVNNVVELRNLALAPGHFLTVTINVATVPSPCSSGTWSVEAKQSNDFSGTPGNDLTLDTANSVLTTTLCAASFTNGTATTTANLSGGKAQVMATAANGARGQLFESGNLATVSSVDCSPAARGGYTTADPNTFGVFTTVHASKAVMITISSPTIPLVGNANQVLKSQQICFDAPYGFTTFAGTPAVSDGAGGFIGLLQTCSGSTVGPCHNRKADSAITDPMTGKVTGVVLVADIPSGLAEDPRMG